MIHLESRRRKRETIEKLHPGAYIADVTSKAADDLVRFSPFYPHGDIPVPGMDRMAQSVEGIWQGLKVFETEGVDETKFDVTNMKGIKRSVRTRGKVLGHKMGNELLPYLEARKRIYLPVYRSVLVRMEKELSMLRVHAETDGLVLLDYETNGDVENLSKPLSRTTQVGSETSVAAPQQIHGKVLPAELS